MKNALTSLRSIAAGGSTYTVRQASAATLSLSAAKTFLDGRLYRGTERPPDNLARRPDRVRQWTGLTEAQFGEASGTSAGPARWLAVPISVNNEIHGHFMVAQFTGPSRDQIDAAVRRVAVAAFLVLVLAAVGGYAAMGRALRPLRAVTETAREIEETDFSRRIDTAS